MVKNSTIIKNRYDKTHMKQFLLKFHLVNDADVIEKLSSVPNMQGYIRQLVRQDLARTDSTLKTKTEENTMRTYKIKPEYLDMWEGGDTPSNPDRIITEEDLRTFSEEWETPIETLLEQLVPIE